MAKKTTTRNFEYPKTRQKGHPTPLHALFVCDTCGQAQWSIAGGYSAHSDHYCDVHRKIVRMRKATPKEIAEGKAILKAEAERIQSEAPDLWARMANFYDFGV
jgi:hypothetical protein